MLEDLFIRLVTISSPSGDESRVAKFINNELKVCGLSSYIDNEGNIIARFDGQGEPLLLSAHLDTVQGTKSIKPVRVKGLIKSSGNTILGADNKAAVASIICALRSIPTAKRRNLEIILSVREETDGGVSKIDLSGLKSKYGISADAGKPIGTIISDTPYIDGFEIKVLGRSSHSSEPENGINALSLASHAISQIKWGKLDEYSTANIGIIKGGSSINTTPGQILLVGEVRSYLKENLSKIKTGMEKVFKDAARIYKGKVIFKYRYYCDGYSHTDQRSLGRITEIYNKLKIREVRLKDFGGSDANFFNREGINVIDIGDGVFNPHTNREFIKVSDLMLLKDIFSNYISA